MLTILAKMKFLLLSDSVLHVFKRKRVIFPITVPHFRKSYCNPPEGPSPLIAEQMHRLCMEESLKKLQKNTERSNILYFQFLMKCSEICNGDSKEGTRLARKFQDSYDVTVFEGKVFLKPNEVSY